MGYYILYPESRAGLVRVVTRKPKVKVKGYGFAEGPLLTIRGVVRRLNAMGVPMVNRPLGLRQLK